MSSVVKVVTTICSIIFVLLYQTSRKHNINFSLVIEANSFNLSLLARLGSYQAKISYSKRTFSLRVLSSTDYVQN